MERRREGGKYVAKLKPIEERDPYAALVLDDFDRLDNSESVKCRCGCGRPAKWFITGDSPEGAYADEPACNSSARYVEECAAEFNCAFSKRPVDA
jgi:hypothetical protein